MLPVFCCGGCYKGPSQSHETVLKLLVLTLILEHSRTPDQTHTM